MFERHLITVVNPWFFHRLLIRRARREEYSGDESAGQRPTREGGYSRETRIAREIAIRAN